MGANDSPSSATRPQNERSPSAPSLSRGSPSDGTLAKSHKGSSRQLHKAHAVGHGRHPHPRVPSYGKGLHKLSKLGPGNTAEAAGRGKNHTRSASHTPSTSPTTLETKRNSSHVSLPRSGSKVSIKKNHSQVSLPRHGSTTKLGNQSKSEKAQIKANLRKKGTDDTPVRGAASFEVGDDLQDDEWTEDSSSPYTTRQNSAAPSRPKTPLVRDPPSPDQPQNGHSSHTHTNLPHSPPESPPPGIAEGGVLSAKQRPQTNGGRKSSHYDPPDPQVVTNRLLNRNSSHHAPLSQFSNVSASITPPIRSSSPSDNYGSASIMKEQSMPANGISRFLDASGSGTNSPIPGSVSHLQSNLAHLGRDHDRNTHLNKKHIRTGSASATDGPTPQISKPKQSLHTSSRGSKSAANLTHTTPSISTPSPPVSPSSDSHPTAKPGPSPFESARGADPSAGKSLTQLKLDLQRLSAQRADAPREPHNNPLMMNGYVGMLNTAGLWGAETDMAARVGRQWEGARKEVEGAKRFCPEVIRGSIVARQKASRGDDLAARKYNMKIKSSAPMGSHGSSSGDGGGNVAGRGRIRFEVGSAGRKSFEDGGEGNGELGRRSGELGGQALEELLRRMWVSGEVAVGE